MCPLLANKSPLSDARYGHLLQVMATCEVMAIWPKMSRFGRLRRKSTPENVPIWTCNFDENNFPKIGPKKSQKKSRKKMSINISLHKSARAWVKRRGCKICTYRLKHAKQTANNTNSHHCMHDCDRSSCVQLHGHALVMIWSRAMASWFSYKFI